MKTCSKCKEQKNELEYYKHKYYPDGYRSECKSCSNKYERKRYQKHKELGSTYIKNKPESVRRHNYKKNFGITIEQYEELFEKQNHSCAICKKHQDQLRIRLAVDHNHVTKKVRGLLCDPCNRFLIRNHNDPEIFLKAASYLKETE